MRRFLVFSLATLWACTGVESDFSAEQSLELFDECNAELHALHGDYFGQDPQPEGIFERDCAAGGSIAMTVQRQDGLPTDLLHEFRACSLNGYTLNGNVDYHEVERGLCDGNGIGFNIRGRLTITGSVMGECEIEAREECGEFRGRSCGHSL